MRLKGKKKKKNMKKYKNTIHFLLNNYASHLDMKEEEKDLFLRMLLDLIEDEYKKFWDLRSEIIAQRVEFNLKRQTIKYQRHIERAKQRVEFNLKRKTIKYQRHFESAKQEQGKKLLLLWEKREKRVELIEKLCKSLVQTYEVKKSKYVILRKLPKRKFASQLRRNQIEEKFQPHDKDPGENATIMEENWEQNEKEFDEQFQAQEKALDEEYEAGEKAFQSQGKNSEEELSKYLATPINVHDLVTREGSFKVFKKFQESLKQVQNRTNDDDIRNKMKEEYMKDVVAQQEEDDRRKKYIATLTETERNDLAVQEEKYFQELIQELRKK